MINEFLAPFQGLEHVRAAHGNLAAAELAVEVCAEFHHAPTLMVDARRIAAKRKPPGRSMTHLAEVEPVEVKSDSPYFAHLAMCKAGKPGKPMPI